MLLIGALGVVYGDIGTSPIYTFRECLKAVGSGSAAAEAVLGILSLVFWSLMIVVTVKYVVLVMRADNKGEGGIMALVGLAAHSEPDQKRRIALLMLGVAGAALFYGDGMITPAISVLSAVEGLEVATPALATYVVPITIIVLVGLFILQSRGSARIGSYFGPIMTIWFIVLAVAGLLQIAQAPGVLVALNPVHGVRFLVGHGWTGFLTLGSVFLALTGAEALYADIGSLRSHTDSGRLVRAGVTSFSAELLRPRRIGARAPRRAGKPFLSPVPELAPLSDHVACDCRDSDRIPGSHFRGFLSVSASDAT